MKPNILVFDKIFIHSNEESIEDVTSALRCCIEIFGKEELKVEEPALEVFGTEVSIRLMPRFPTDVPKNKVIRALERLGYRPIPE